VLVYRAVYPIDNGLAVMDTARCRMGIHNVIVLTIGYSMVQIEETFGLFVSDHETTIQICTGDIDVLSANLLGLALQGLFSTFLPVLNDGLIKLFNIIWGTLSDFQYRIFSCWRWP
jgi:hypothetical protein